MAEAQTYIFNYKEVAEALINKQGLHEGLWGVYMEFGIGAANIPSPSGQGLVPAAIVPVVKVGLQRFSEANALTVDAAEVNPRNTEVPTASSTPQKSRRRVKA